MRDSAEFTVDNGLITDQPTSDKGLAGSVLNGENVLIELGRARLARPPADQSETLGGATLAYTVNLTANSKVVAGNSGAAFKTAFVPYSHCLIDRKLYLITKIIDDDTMHVAPSPTANASAVAIATVPILLPLNRQRGALTAGSAVRFRESALFAVGRGALKLDGTALNAALTATTTPQVAYPTAADPDVYEVHPIGFSKPDAIASGDIQGVAGGTRNMPAGTRKVRIARKRKGFFGTGNYSDPVEVTLTANQKVEITFGAFDTTEGQDEWVIASTRTIASSGSTAFGNYYKAATSNTESGAEEFEWLDDELVELIEYDNNPPPPCLYLAVLDDYLLFCSTYGTPDADGEPTAPGPGIAFSKLENPEATGRGARAFVSGNEDIVGVWGGDSRVFILKPSSVDTGALTRADQKILVIRPYWKSGVPHQFAACVYEDVLYAITKRGLARSFEKPSSDSEKIDSSEIRFSARVRSIFKPLIRERCFIGADFENELVVVVHSNDQLGTGGKWQSRAISYNVRDNIWNPPVILGDGTSSDFTVTGIATVGTELFLCTSDNKTWKWDASTSSVSAWLGFPICHFGTPATLKTVRYAEVVGQANGTLSLHANATDLATGGGSVTQSLNDVTLPQHPVKKFAWKTNALAVRVSGSGDDGEDFLDSARVFIEVPPNRRNG